MLERKIVRIMSLAIFLVLTLIGLLQGKVLAMDHDKEKKSSYPIKKNYKYNSVSSEKKKDPVKDNLTQQKSIKQPDKEASLSEEGSDYNSHSSGEDSEPEKVPERKKEKLRDDDILKKRNISIGTTSWNGIYVSGIQCYHREEIKEPLFRKIHQLYKDSFCKKYLKNDYCSPYLKGLVFDNCLFDEDMLDGSFFSDLHDYSQRYTRKNSTKIDSRSIYFQNCRIHVQNNASKPASSTELKEKIVGVPFKNWVPH